MGAYSCEFFPPKSDAAKAQLRETAATLRLLAPAYLSVTFGAGGSTQAGTFETIAALQDDGFTVAPHISCVGTTRSEIRDLLHRYRDRGVRRIVALRGDLPSGLVDRGDLHYASELVAFIRAETGDWFHIEVAAYPEMHPQAPSPRVDIDHFCRKVQAGANAAITQYFYNVDAYARFVDAVSRRGVTVPIVPGIMPITNYAQLQRFSDTCGAEIPRWIRLRLMEFGDDLTGLRAFGRDVTLALCRRLLELGAPGLHFYTLNRAEPTAGIWRELGLPLAAAGERA